MKLNAKLFISYSALFVILMISVALYQYHRECKFRAGQLNAKLEAYNDMFYHSYTLPDSLFRELLTLLPDTALRVSIIDSSGIVIYDSAIEPDTLENHLSRPEIAALKAQIVGTDVRMSASNGQEYYYLAQQFGHLYIRSALPYDVSLAGALRANMDFLYFIAIAVLVVMLLIYFISDKLSATVNDVQARLKRQLTQNVSHELKTPVAAILGYAESLMNNPDIAPERQRFFIERTYRQSKRLSALLQDISTLNRLDDSPKNWEREEVDIVSVIYDVIADTADEADSHSVLVEKKLPPDLMINGNHALLYSIFRNLVDNSVAYAGEGATVRISLSHTDPQYYYFSVRDNGVGIPEEHINRIFERFYRVDKGRSRKLGGTGLGLAIVKNAVLFHRGTIEVHNIQPSGVEFLFSLHR